MLLGLIAASRTLFFDFLIRASSRSVASIA
jgi:hypothetical protein